MRGVDQVFEVYVPKGSLTTGYHPALGGDLFSISEDAGGVDLASRKNATVAEKRNRGRGAASGSETSSLRPPLSPLLLSKRAAARQSQARNEMVLLSWGPSKALSKTVGVARRTTLVQTIVDCNRYIMDVFLDGLLKMHENIRVKGWGSKLVLNISHSTVAGGADAGWVRMLAYLLKELIKLGVTVVTGSGNVSPIFNRRAAPVQMAGPVWRPGQP